VKPNFWNRLIQITKQLVFHIICLSVMRCILSATDAQSAHSCNPGFLGLICSPTESLNILINRAVTFFGFGIQ